MEVAEKPWFGDLMFLRGSESDASRRKGVFAPKKTQLAGWTGWWLLYNHPCLGTQNGNP
jgi:hypothetical protein